METGELRKDVDRAIAAGDASGAARMLASAWEREPGSALAGFVASRYERIAGSLGLLKQRWAILRSFTVEPVVPVLKAGAYAAGVALEIHMGEFNAYAQEVLDPASAFYRFQPDVAVLAVQTRDVAPGLWRGESAADDVLVERDRRGRAAGQLEYFRCVFGQHRRGRRIAADDHGSAAVVEAVSGGRKNRAVRHGERRDRQAILLQHHLAGIRTGD